MGLTAIDHLRRLLDHVQTLVIPNAPRRRVGPDSAFVAAVRNVQDSMEEIHRYAVEEGGGNIGELRSARVDLTLEIASILFASGAPHRSWRWWASQAAHAQLAYGELPSAAVWSVLAHDDELVAELPEAPEPEHEPGLVVWWLASSPRVLLRTHNLVQGDDVDRAWTSLSHSIPVKDHAATERALRTVANFWMDEDEDWESFHPGYYPDFEPELNAAATLARKVGWRPVDWPSDALRFLEPGLANGGAS